MSRSLSPTRLIATMVMRSATPGKKLIQQRPESRCAKPFEIGSPSRGRGTTDPDIAQRGARDRGRGSENPHGKMRRARD